MCIVSFCTFSGLSICVRLIAIVYSVDERISLWYINTSIHYLMLAAAISDIADKPLWAFVITCSMYSLKHNLWSNFTLKIIIIKLVFIHFSIIIIFISSALGKQLASLQSDICWETRKTGSTLCVPNEMMLINGNLDKVSHRQVLLVLTLDWHCLRCYFNHSMASETAVSEHT